METAGSQRRSEACITGLTPRRPGASIPGRREILGAGDAASGDRRRSQPIVRKSYMVRRRADVNEILAKIGGGDRARREALRLIRGGRKLTSWFAFLSALASPIVCL